MGVALLFALPLLPIARGYTAAVRGVVADSTKASVPGAAVVIKDVDRNTEYPAKTDNEGRCVALSLPPGRYELTANAPGIEQSTHGSLTVNMIRYAVN
jgi:hypothetical protein